MTPMKNTRLFIELIRVVGAWYDSLDIRRLHENTYRNREVNRLAHAIMTSLDNAKETDY